MSEARDHGGGVDAARARWGGARADWIDLSTGINPTPYPLPHIPPDDWAVLPDARAEAALIDAAREAWPIPDAADVLAAPGTSALIARLPVLAPEGAVRIPGPTYNEHAAAFAAHGRPVTEDGPAPSLVLVHPNNPDGRDWHVSAPDMAQFAIIDESFADAGPYGSFLDRTERPGTIVLRGIGKFWGLAGLRLGFAIGHPATLAPLRDLIGPWAVSGPALRIGTAALRDRDWAEAMRTRIAASAARLDELMGRHAAPLGGTPLFRLYDVGDAAAMQDRLARHHIWSRIFPYSKSWVRLGLPPHEGWPRLEDALA